MEKQTIKELVSAYFAASSAMAALVDHGQSHDRDDMQNAELASVLSQQVFVCECLGAALRRELPDTPQDEWAQLIDA